MKRPILILFAVSLFWHCQVMAASLPLPPARLPIGWQRIEIPEVGTIDIPPSMEVRENQPPEDSAGTMPREIIIIQQKGHNESDSMVASSYVRVVVATDVVNSGDFEGLNSRFEVTSDELYEISTLIRTQMEAEVEVQTEAKVKNQFGKILRWDMPSLTLINGMQAIRLSYRYQHQNNPTRLIIYIFQNGDRVHWLGMSYPETEKDKWLPDFPVILSSFRITNARGRKTSGAPSLVPKFIKWLQQYPEITNVQSEETSGR